MKIRYGINKPNPGKRPKILHENHGADIKATFANMLPAVRAYIAENHPGWSLTGYAPDRKRKVTK